MVGDINKRQREFEKQFLLNPIQWPEYPVCCLMRREGTDTLADCGIVLSTVQFEPVVFVVNWTLAKLTCGGQKLAEALKNVERKRYSDLDTLLMDWRID